jgi:hypothetical protein
MCRAYIPSFFYNSTSGRCEQFIYGGCGGNSNRFTTVGACEHRCRPRTAPAVRPAAPARGAPRTPTSGACPTPARPCNKRCPNGFIMENNCPVCACVPLNPNCPAIDCPTPCPRGQQNIMGADNCITCECEPSQRGARTPRSPRRRQSSRESVECPTNSCLKECPNGFAKDRFGCEVCVCATAKHWRRRTTDAATAAQCPTQVACAMYCPHGFVKGPDGCDKCECAEEGAAGRGKGGRGGFVTHGGKHHGGRHHHHNRTSEAGKPVQIPSNIPGSPAQLPSNIPGVPAQLPANIPPAPAQLPAGGRTRGDSPAQLPANIPSRGGKTRGDAPAQLPAQSDCPTVRNCHRRCAHGRQQDAFGCEICGCRTRPAARRTLCAACTMYCEAGYKVGADGCNLCECNVPVAVQPTVPAQCGDRAICRMNCEKGFKNGADGCPICECN